jgi:hypothetical protein
MKTVTLELTKTELEYLYNVVDDHIRSGIYWGKKENFDSLQKKVFDKVEEAYDILCEQS